jgi:DNA-binding transcriptional ArsR family regulator
MQQEPMDAVFSALGNGTRRALLDWIVTDGQAPVQALADRAAISRPSISEHLKVLKDAGLVSETKVGRQRFYRVEPEPLLRAREWFDTYEAFWRERMARLRVMLEAEPDHE